MENVWARKLFLKRSRDQVGKTIKQIYFKFMSCHEIRKQYIVTRKGVLRMRVFLKLLTYSVKSPNLMKNPTPI